MEDRSGRKGDNNEKEGRKRRGGGRNRRAKWKITERRKNWVKRNVKIKEERREERGCRALVLRSLSSLKLEVLNDIGSERRRFVGSQSYRSLRL